MFCQKCGKEMSDGAMFCPNCGWSKTGTKPVANKNVNLPIVPIIGLIALVAVGFLFKNLFFGGSGNFGRSKLVTEYSSDTIVDKMATVKFGSYPQSDASGVKKEPIEWIVLDRDTNSRKVLLLSKYILDCKCYEDSGDKTTWENCSLRKWLNNDFYYQAFGSSEQSKIENTYVTNNNNIDYGTAGGNNTNDKVFCLSIEETRQYFGSGTKEGYGYMIGKKLATSGTNYAKTVDNGSSKLWVYKHSEDTDSDAEEYKWADGNSPFWLRSPGYDQGYAARVNSVGYLITYGDYVVDHNNGVRPALWVSY